VQASIALGFGRYEALIPRPRPELCRPGAQCPSVDAKVDGQHLGLLRAVLPTHYHSGTPRLAFPLLLNPWSLPLWSARSCSCSCRVCIGRHGARTEASRSSANYKSATPPRAFASSGFPLKKRVPPSGPSTLRSEDPGTRPDNLNHRGLGTLHGAVCRAARAHGGASLVLRRRVGQVFFGAWPSHTTVLWPGRLRLLRSPPFVVLSHACVSGRPGLAVHSVWELLASARDSGVECLRLSNNPPCRFEVIALFATPLLVITRHYTAKRSDA